MDSIEKKPDAIDRKILEILRKDARIHLKELSRHIKLSLPAASERLRKLEQSGYIKGYVAILNPQKFNKEFTCFCMVEFSHHNIDYDRDFVEFVKTCPDILECHRIGGTYEYMLKIVAHSVKEVEQLIDVMRIEKRVINTSTITILTTIKEEVTISPE
ncbi:transcriptional regulator, AsnC family [Treponema primitia ZAS-2]|uniref:Transcriptional regulator, AsnC family n=1 Tax=Treponema primitia (strain ATCC BAA-887 / DSM 12427 / ZAS-2) TaxID=545694 RepID=F5YIA9_TREPZ|nr:Lrp/AsnC family transcriptional regulator [Treponema primitia]AEF86916.1 transcriptional regulator, AsnC family [Treponema primitia ZAS-2]